MKNFLSVIVAVVLVLAVGGAVANGTMASFLDTQVSTENQMCAGTLILRVTGGPIEAGPIEPCNWYQQEMELMNCGTKNGIAYLKLENIKGIEDALGLDVTSEPEYVAEYGGELGQQILPGLGEDRCDVQNHVYIEIWYDKDGDGIYERGCGCNDELIYAGKLGQVPPCKKWKLGTLEASQQINCGWGTYFEYDTGEGTEAAPVMAPLIANRTKKVGWVYVWDDGTDLHVKYDTTESGWKMKETHLYVGAVKPPTAAPGQFKFYPPSPLPHENLGGATIDNYTVPLGGLTHVYIAAHAAGGKCGRDTAWAMRGPPRKLLVKLHVQDVPEACFCYDFFDETDPDVANKCWDHWPTNAYMGDICEFDMKFFLDQCYCYSCWQWRSCRGWTYNWCYR
jgi:hypothetical protein